MHKVRDGPVVFLGAALEIHQAIPGRSSGGDDLAGKARFFKQIAQHFAHKGGIVRNQSAVAGIGPVFAKVVQPQSQLGVEVGHNLFKIQQKNDAVFKFDHADNRIVGNGGHVSVRRFNLFPTDAVDAVDARNHERRGDVIEFRHNGFGLFFLGGMGFSQPHGKIHKGNDARAEIECAKNTGVLHFGQLRNLGHADDFQHLGHVDAVIATVGLGGYGLAIFVCLRFAKVGRREFIQIEFNYFQLIGAGFQQDIGLGHTASRKMPLLRNGLKRQQP